MRTKEQKTALNITGFITEQSAIAANRLRLIGQDDLADRMEIIQREMADVLKDLISSLPADEPAAVTPPPAAKKTEPKQKAAQPPKAAAPAKKAKPQRQQKIKSQHAPGPTATNPNFPRWEGLPDTTGEELY